MLPQLPPLIPGKSRVDWGAAGMVFVPLFLISILVDIIQMQVRSESESWYYTFHDRLMRVCIQNRNTKTYSIKCYDLYSAFIPNAHHMISSQCDTWWSLIFPTPTEVPAHRKSRLVDGCLGRASIYRIPSQQRLRCDGVVSFVIY